MECLFTTNTKSTFEEYKKFSKALLRNKIRIIFWAAIYALSIVLCIMQQSIKLLVFFVFYNLFFEWVYARRIKKAYMHNKSNQNVDITVEFYDTYLIQKTENSEAKVEYENLYKIIETKTNFYIMIGDNQGCVLVKENMSEELEKFVRDMKEKYCKKARRKK